MKKHPCRECKLVTGGQDLTVEPCRSCLEPSNYVRSLGVAGIGTVPIPTSDCRPKKERSVMQEKQTTDSQVDVFPCKQCGVPKPRTAEHFAKHGRTKDGLHTTCRECVGKLISQGSSDKKKKRAMSGHAGGGGVPKNITTNPQSYETIETSGIRWVDFAGREALLESIEKEAFEQFRNFDAQILFILHTHINNQRTGIIP